MEADQRYRDALSAGRDELIREALANPSQQMLEQLGAQPESPLEALPGPVEMGPDPGL